MYRLIELKSRLVASATMTLIASILFVLATDAREAANARKLTTPQGVRLLMNKSFDDSDQARKEILDGEGDARNSEHIVQRRFPEEIAHYPSIDNAPLHNGKIEIVVARIEDAVA